MKLKTLVGIFLAATIFLLGSIIIIGAIPSKGFLIAYAAFVIGVIVVTVIMTANTSKKWDIAYIIFIGIIFAIFLSVFGSALKDYNDVYQESYNNGELLNHEIDNSEQKIKYYEDFADYLENEINSLKISNDNIEAQIEENKRQAKLINQSIPKPVEQEPEIIYIRRYHDDEREHEEEDDDD